MLDCAGYTLTGSNQPGAWYGIHLDAASGAEVRNCRVTLFRRGIRLRGGGGNALVGNEVFGNRYGIDLAEATSGNRIEGNAVHDNRDEGIHVGTGIPAHHPAATTDACAFDSATGGGKLSASVTGTPDIKFAIKLAGVTGCEGQNLCPPRPSS